MSVNQSRGDKNEYPSQHKKSNRSGNSSSQRNFSGNKGGAAAGTTTFSSNKSFKKANSHAQGVQTWVNSPNTNAESVNTSAPGGANVPNGPHSQQPARGLSGAPATGANIKRSDVSNQKISLGLPRAPQGNAGVPASEGTGPSTPTKDQADASRGFSLQFGSISPGLMNGMQVPARTSSAPPNFDDQKQAQARHESLKSVKAPTPAVPKQQLPRKDAGPVDQFKANEAHLIPTPKKEVQPLPSPSTQSQKLSGPPIPGVSMQAQIPFHHPQLHVQYGGLTPQMQSQGMTNMPLPIPLAMGSPPQVQQPVFVTGIQHHPMQPPQGIIHQGQSLNFSSQIGPPQMAPQLGSMGIGLGQHYLQQQTGKHSALRKTVKITHPDTHEELRLDGGLKGPGPRSTYAHGMPQSQAIPSFPPGHPMNYYNGSPLFFQPPPSNPLASTQTTHASQPPRLYSQVTVKPAANALEKVSDSASVIDKDELSKTPGDHGTSTGLSTIASKSSNATFGSFQSENSSISASPAIVEDEVAKGPIVSKSASYKEKKVQSTPLDQEAVQLEVLKASIPVMGTKEEEVSETSKKAAAVDFTASNGEEGLRSTETSDVQEPNDEAVGSDDRKEDVMNNEPEQHGLATSTTDQKLLASADPNVLSTETSSLSLGPSVCDDIPVSESGSGAVSVSVPEGEDTVDTASLESPTSLVSMVDTSKAKGNVGKSKKKKKDILKLADAQGTNSDLYNAYKGPEEKKGTLSPETLEISSGITAKQVEKDVPRSSNKFEPDDWEDAADISTPKLDTPGNLVGNDGMAKKYSRDFLLKFSEQCKKLPNGVEVTPDISDAVVSVNASRESYPSPGRVVDRSAARLDRRPSNVSHDDRWNSSKQPFSIAVPGWDPRIDNSYSGNIPGFRPVHGVLRNPRASTPNQYTGGILSGLMQSPGPYMQRNYSDSDRWQRASRGFPSPHTPMPVMHKAEKKYEVGKVTDEEQAKQRQLKGILNKLTPQNFEKLFDQVKQVNIDNAATLSGVINQIFDKALMEPTFCEMYANFCSRLAVDLPDFSEDNQKITFKRLLLNKCQEEFERGEREEQEANRTEEEGEIKQTEEQREEKRIKARRRMLGNIRLIGELYKKKMLTERIMHECIKKLLGQYQNPDEEDIESLCKLMTTIGAMIDHPKAKEHIDAYFATMLRLSDNMILSSRLRFMLKDVIDLRKNKWQQRRKVDGPKKIDEVHRDIIQERHEQTTRLARGPSFNSSIRRGPSQPMDFGLRGSNSNLLPSPNSQMGSFRGPTQQLRGYGNQDSQIDEKQLFENRMLSIPFRPVGDNDSITLGPQGGLARGMSIRGQPSIQSTPLSEPADSRKVAPGPNGFGPRDDLGSRYISERLAPQPIYGPSYVNRDTKNPEQGFDHGTPSSQVWVATPSQNVSSDKIWPEERLRDRSMQAIKEFYSARDEKEVALCIKDLNAPSYYPSMISIWVSDSFERKDVDRDSLTKLLVNLAKAQDGMLNQDSYIQGFEAVLATLEDSVNDAPRAAEYFGRIFGKLLIEDVIPYKDAWRLIYEGGEEQGRLVEIGLAAEVLGVILEIIKSEKGEPFLNEVCAGSNPNLEEFRPPNIKKPLRLDKFI